MLKNQFVRDVQEKDIVESAFLVKFSSVMVGKTGKPYMNLVLVDKSGEIEARIWDSVETYSQTVSKDKFILLKGRCQLYQGRRQLVVDWLTVLAENQINIADYKIVGQKDAEVIYQQLLGYIATMQDPHYKALAESIFIHDVEIVAKLKLAPAGKSIHHAYQSGLIEHILSITKILDFLSQLYAAHLNRDLLLMGGFLHDLCKIWELQWDKNIDYTVRGKLVGHLVMGVELVNEKIQQLSLEYQPFPEEKKYLLQHVLLAHHGKLEYGSPVPPKCLEAVVVHLVDDLDSKVDSISNFILQDQTAGKFTSMHRVYERSFYKPSFMKKGL